MMDFLRKHQKVIFTITLIGLIAGVFIGFGSYTFGGKTALDAVAEINGKKIPYKRFTYILNQAIEDLRSKKVEITADVINQQKQQVLQQMIQEEVFFQEANKYGIKVPDVELAARLQSIPAFQKEGRFDQRAYMQVVFNVLHTTPAEYEESVRRSIANSKLRNLISQSIRISSAEIQSAYYAANEGDMRKFEKDKDAFTTELRNKKLMEVSTEWFKKLNQGVKIQVYLNEIENQNR